MAKTLQPIQAARGIAAVAVVAFHANGAVPFSPLASYGWLAVPFFFLLSGYIIAHVHGTGGVEHYFRARLVRIYAPYLPVGIVAAIGYVILGRPVDWLASITLLPGTTALIPAWTLQHEVAFYALFGLGIALNRRRIVMGIWSGAIIVRCLIPLHLDVIEQVVLAPINLLFVAGVALRATGWQPAYQSPRALNALGDASYAIYLVHLPVIGILWRCGASFPALLVGGIGAGFAYHYAVERPMLDWLKHRSLRRASTSPASPRSRKPSRLSPLPQGYR